MAIHWITEENEKRIDALLAEMTLEEKIGQMRQPGPSLVGAFEVSFEELLDMRFDGKISDEEFQKMMSSVKMDYREEEVKAGKVGSFNGVSGAETVNAIQENALQSRHKIPLLFGMDVIHGYKTVYPIPLALAGSFEPELYRRAAEMAAEEASAAGVHWTYAPMVDVARDARWGRISEGAGEDTYLASVFAVHTVQGFQGEDISDGKHIIACAKHFAAYGGAEAGRDYNTIDISEQKLREVYLPPFEAAIKAGVGTLMPAFNDISGVPCSVNHQLLTEILRDEWGFEGFLISDANAIDECVNHGIAEDRKDAARQSVLAGMDMDMSSDCFFQNLEQLVKEGKVAEAEIDQAVRRILRLKFALGLVDQPIRTNTEREQETMLKPEFRALAREAAEKSIVLLKNENEALPLAGGKTLALIGALAADGEQMLGAWAMGGDGEACVSVKAALEAARQPFTWISGRKEDGSVDSEGIRTLCGQADIVLVAAGEQKEESGEAASRGELSLHPEDRDILRLVKESGKKSVLLLFNGRPLVLTEEVELVDAILECWHPGTEAGNAIVNILTGKVNPSAKITASFPAAVGQCPIYYNHTSTGRPAGKGKFTSKYLDIPVEPLYPFGYGLSYTSYEYANLKAEIREEAFQIEVTVKNTGERAGEEAVQIYLQDVAASRVRPVKELKAFEKVALEAGEQRKLCFTIPVAEMGFYSAGAVAAKPARIVESGLFRVYAGGNSRDTLCTEISYAEL